MARPVFYDFRPYQPDAYLPPDQRAAHAAFFDGIKAGDKRSLRRALKRARSFVISQERAVFWIPLLGEPVARNSRLLLFERSRRQAK
jgi:hypothetical protein